MNNSWQQPGLNNNIPGPQLGGPQTGNWDPQQQQVGQQTVYPNQQQSIQKTGFAEYQGVQQAGYGDHQPVVLNHHDIQQPVVQEQTGHEQVHQQDNSEQSGHQAHQQEEAGQVQQGISGEYYPELTLDPSGQWYWDYNQQQWFPYYPPQAGETNAPSTNSNTPVVENTAGAPEEFVDKSGQQGGQVDELANNIDNLHINQENPDLNRCGHFNNQERLAESALPIMTQAESINAHSEMSRGLGNNTPSYPQSGDNSMLSYNTQSADNSMITQTNQGADNNMSSMNTQAMENSVYSYQGDGVDNSALYQGGTPGQYVHQDVPERQRQDSVMSSSSSKHNEPYLRQPSVESMHYPPFSQGDVSVQEYPAPPPQQLPAAARDASPVKEPGGMGPPDLVDHRPNTAQPEIVSDINRPEHGSAPGFQSQSVPPPDMFASLPGSAPPPSFGQSPDLAAVPAEGARMDPSLGPVTAPSLQQQHNPDLGASYYPGSMVHNNPDLMTPPSAGPPLQPPRLRPAPDLTAQSVINNSTVHSAEVGNPPVSQSVSHDQHYDFYKGQFESAMPDLTSNRSSVIPPTLAAPSQEVQGKAPDILRTEPLVPTSDRNLFMETGELREEDAVRVSQGDPPLSPYMQSHGMPSPINLPMQPSGKPPSGLPPMVGGNDPPSLVRMVVGESLSSPQPPPLASGQRMVEGESTQPPGLPPPLPAREVEGEALQDPRNSINVRTIEGEDGSSNHLIPLPVGPREVEGQFMIQPGGRQVTGLHSPSAQQFEDFASSTPTTPLESSPTHINSLTEARSEAAGSERRDQTVMGGPPAMKAPPLPTPGRAVAGQESNTPYGARRRGDNHKKSTYDSDEDRNPDSESERERDPRYPQPRRTVSPGGRSYRSKPNRIYDRLNRDSTDRDEDSDRRNRDYNRDRRDDDRRKDYGRYDRGRYRDSRRNRDEDDDTFRDDDRQSMRGGSRKKEEPSRYREDYYRRHRMESDYERESHYGGDDYLNR